MRLYVESYELTATGNDHWSEYDYAQQNGPTGYFYVDDRRGETSESWYDGTGGNGEWLWHEQISAPGGGQINDSHSGTVWPPSSYPNVADGTVTMTGYGSDDYETNAGSPIIWEHCDLGVPLVDMSDTYTEHDFWNNYSYSYFTYQDHETRQAQAVIKLQTGGKAASQRQNLFVFNGSANRTVPVRDPSWHNPLLPVLQISIPFQNITVAGKALGNDGNLYLGLPDNQDVDVTPTVSGIDYYTFNLPTPQECTPTIIANGNDLSVTNPTFCVGQQIPFSLSWSSAPPNVADTIQQWTLPGEYVNERWQNYYANPEGPLQYYGSVNYRIDSTLLANAVITNCWYINTPGGTVTMWQNLHFTNGQYASIAVDGDITVYKPQVTFPFLPANIPNIIPRLTATWLELGDRNAIPTGTAEFGALILSEPPFTGAVNWTQLIRRSVTYPYSGTGGAYALDNSQFYNNANTSINVIGRSPNPRGVVSFFDNPGVADWSWYPWSITIKDDFQTYLMFQPVGDGSIWVPLGFVTWGWGATESNATLTSPSTIQPSYQSSDQFPTWMATSVNSRYQPPGN